MAKDEPFNISVSAAGAPFVSLAAELGLSSRLYVDLGISRTLRQTFESNFDGSRTTSEMVWTQVHGGLIIRHGPATEGGGVRPLFFQIGGGITIYQLGRATFPAGNFDANRPMFFAGAGYNLPVGPRATIQLFGRAQMITAYESSGLDDFNAQPPSTNVEGSSLINFQFGAGFRFGR